jgi:hypothetical protein
MRFVSAFCSQFPAPTVTGIEAGGGGAGSGCSGVCGGGVYGGRVYIECQSAYGFKKPVDRKHWRGVKSVNTSKYIEKQLPIVGLYQSICFESLMYYWNGIQ